MKIKVIMIVAVLMLLISCESNDATVNNEEIKPEVDTVVENIEAVHNDVSENIETIDSSEETEIDEADTPDQGESSRDLNTKGYELYQKGNYVEALKYFESAFEEDENYIHAHYNYACTLGVLMKLDYPEWYVYREDVHKHLKIAVEINPDYIEKIKSDSDLEIIRKDFEYFKLLGYGTETDEDIRHLLISLDWHINGPGVISPIGGASFNQEGTFTLSFLDLEMFLKGEYPLDTDTFTGHYVVKDGTVYFTLDEKMLKRHEYEDFSVRDVYEEKIEFTGTLDEDGTLYIDIFDYPIHNWMDEFSA